MNALAKLASLAARRGVCLFQKIPSILILEKKTFFEAGRGGGTRPLRMDFFYVLPKDNNRNNS